MAIENEYTYLQHLGEGNVPDVRLNHGSAFG